MLKHFRSNETCDSPFRALSRSLWQRQGGAHAAAFSSLPRDKNSQGQT
jgi:hypothetical protein